MSEEINERELSRDKGSVMETFKKMVRYVEENEEVLDGFIIGVKLKIIEKPTEYKMAVITGATIVDTMIIASDINKKMRSSLADSMPDIMNATFGEGGDDEE